MKKLTFLLVLVGSFPLVACDKKSPPTTKSVPSSSAAATKPVGEAVPTGGSLDLEIDDEATNMKVGPAYAIPTAREGGNVYYFMAFNAGARETSCETKIKGDAPVGGDNWAVALDMSSGAAPFKASDKTKDYDDVSASVFFVATQGPWKGTARGLNPFGTDAEKKLTLSAVDDKTINVKVDVSNKSGHVRGEFKAKLCPPAP